MRVEKKTLKKKKEGAHKSHNRLNHCRLFIHANSHMIKYLKEEVLELALNESIICTPLFSVNAESHDKLREKKVWR